MNLSNLIEAFFLAYIFIGVNLSYVCLTIELSEYEAIGTVIMKRQNKDEEVTRTKLYLMRIVVSIVIIFSAPYTLWINKVRPGHERDFILSNLRRRV